MEGSVDTQKKSGMTVDEKKEYAKLEVESINSLLSIGCSCKGKCSSRKCMCKNYGRVCTDDCKCNSGCCTNRNSLSTEL